jgi:hypothetical protein
MRLCVCHNIGENKGKERTMKDKILKILVRLAHLSEKLNALSEEVDRLYEVLGDQAFIDMIKSEESK